MRSMGGKFNGAGREGGGDEGSKSVIVGEGTDDVLYCHPVFRDFIDPVVAVVS